MLLVIWPRWVSPGYAIRIGTLDWLIRKNHLKICLTYIVGYEFITIPMCMYHIISKFISILNWHVLLEFYMIPHIRYRFGFHSVSNTPMQYGFELAHIGINSSGSITIYCKILLQNFPIIVVICCKNISVRMTRIV